MSIDTYTGCAPTRERTASITPGDADAVDVTAVHDGESQLLVVEQIRAVVERAANADMRRIALDDQSFLARPAKRRSVGVGRVEVGVPRVEVGVEVDQRQASVDGSCGPQRRQRDRVVAAEAHHRMALAAELGNAGRNLLDCPLDVERRAYDVARIDHLRVAERHRVERRVVGTKQPGGLSDR
jgi:hypothetical protein